MDRKMGFAQEGTEGTEKMREPLKQKKRSEPPHVGCYG
jgi:hypothetical protein